MISLNQAQNAAVAHREGPLLLVAGAGAGKTRTVIHRIARLIESGVPAERVLAVTFTNKAAREMADRVGQLGLRGGQPTVSTFHGLGARLLRESGTDLGLSRHFSILDRDESEAVVGQAIASLGLDRKLFPKGKIQRLISREKNRGKTNPDTWENQQLTPIWRRYEELLRERHGLDFDDLILRPLTLLRENPARRAEYQNRWHYLHVDEYQDTNGPQYELTKLLAGERRNVCVVGDIDQSIYSWRGADYRNLLRFERDFPGTKIIVLEENYRSTKTIIALANRVIAENPNRPEKNLFTHNPDGEPVKLLIASDETEEADLVLGELLTRREREPEATNAILYRANFQSRALEDACLRHGVPYQVLGTRFFDRQEVRDALAYLRLALNPNDWFSLARAAARPPRGLGKSSLAKIASGEAAGLGPAARQRWQNLKNITARLAAKAATDPPSVVLAATIRQSGLLDFYDEPDENGLDRRRNLEELVSVAARYDADPRPDGLWRLLDEAALVSDQDSLDDKAGERAANPIRLMTVHAAKGLEFDHVFITGLEQDLFPSRPRENDERGRTEALAEERRLFYVAVTRAKQTLTLTYAESRLAAGARQGTWPSEFLNHLTIE